MTGDIQRRANFFKNISLQNHWPGRRIRAYHQMTDQIVMLTYFAPWDSVMRADLPQNKRKNGRASPPKYRKKITPFKRIIHAHRFIMHEADFQTNSQKNVGKKKDFGNNPYKPFDPLDRGSGPVDNANSLSNYYVLCVYGDGHGGKNGVFFCLHALDALSIFYILHCDSFTAQSNGIEHLAKLCHAILLFFLSPCFFRSAPAAGEASAPG